MDDRAERLRMKRDQAIEKLDSIVVEWQGDGPDDLLVRSMIGSMRMLIEPLAELSTMNQSLQGKRMIAAAYLTAFHQQTPLIQMLDIITSELKDGREKREPGE